MGRIFSMHRHNVKLIKITLLHGKEAVFAIIGKSFVRSSDLAIHLVYKQLISSAEPLIF